MTGSNQEGNPADFEAAYWLVALEDAPGDTALRDRFEAWLDADPAHAEAWAETSEIYDMMAETPAAGQAHWTARAAGPQESRQELRHRGFARRGRIAVGAAALAVAACLAIVVLPSLLLRLEADHVTATAETRSVELPDGSTVRLAPDSAIAVEFSGTERRVRLVRGEAFFEVVPDAAHPFRVAAEDMTTTVLGTAFDVRLADECATVAVSHGSVAVDYPNMTPPVSKRLAAGDWVRVKWGGEVSQGKTPPDQVAAWMQGMIVARDRSLASVVDDLRRYYRGAIVIADGGLGERRISGVYNIADPAAALAAMAGAHGATVHRISPWILVVTAG